jgi:LysM domain
MTVMSTAKAGAKVATAQAGTAAGAAATAGPTGTGTEGRRCGPEPGPRFGSAAGAAALGRPRMTEFRASEVRMREVRVWQRQAGRASDGGLLARESLARESLAGEVLGRVPHTAAHRPLRPPGQQRRSRQSQGPGRLRLTRRGRMVVAGLAVIVAAALATLFWISAAGGAQASGAGQPPRAAYRDLTQVVVRPGQSLWSIAAAAEPSADPRIVVQQIMAVNALSGTVVHAGELLWVPRG